MTDTENTEDSRIGTILNERYRIIERIAAGGMAVVYRGERVELGRPVAIKFLQEIMLQYPKFISRFEAEAKAMSKLSHPYCVSVMDFGVDGAPYIVMDYVEGRTLKAVLASEKVTPTRAITIVRQILAGIAHAHSQGIIHRDLKPENIMVQDSVGVGETVRIFDFGLAKLVDAASAGSMSVSSLVAGTPNYMSPEQSRGKKVDERTDLYSICVVLFELLSGRKPFLHEDFIEVVRMHRETAAPELNEISGEGAFSKELEAVVKKALSKSPDNRYQTAEEFAAALDETPEGFRAKESEMSIPPDPKGKTLPIGAKTPFRAVGEPTQKVTMDFKKPTPPRRRSRELTVFVAILIGVLISIVVLQYLSNEDEPPEVSVTALQPPVKAIASAVSEGSPKHSTKKAATAAKTDAATADPATGQKANAQTPSDESSAANMEVRNVKDVARLIKEGDRERAIVELKKFRREQPRNAQVVFMLGDLYFQKVWWADAMEHYAEAIRLDPSYKRRQSIQRDLIIALSSDKTYHQAAQVLKTIGAPALPMLRRAYKRDPLQIIRKRALAVIKKIQSKN